MLSVVTDAQAQDELRLDLDELAWEGARRMLVAALEVEVADYLARYGEARDARGTPRWCGTAMWQARKVTGGGRHPGGAGATGR